MSQNDVMTSCHDVMTFCNMSIKCPNDLGCHSIQVLQISFAQGVALASSAATCDLQDQSFGVQDLAEQETGVSALLTDSLRTSSMLAIEGTFLVD